MSQMNQEEVINQAKLYSDKMNRVCKCYTSVARHTDNLISMIYKKDAEISELKRIISEQDEQALEDAQRFIG